MSQRERAANQRFTMNERRRHVTLPRPVVKRDISMREVYADMLARKPAPSKPGNTWHAMPLSNAA